MAFQGGPFRGMNRGQAQPVPRPTPQPQPAQPAQGSSVGAPMARPAYRPSAANMNSNINGSPMPSWNRTGLDMGRNVPRARQDGGPGGTFGGSQGNMQGDPNAITTNQPPIMRPGSDNYNRMNNDINNSQSASRNYSALADSIKRSDVAMPPASDIPGFSQSKKLNWLNSMDPSQMSHRQQVRKRQLLNAYGRAKLQNVPPGQVNAPVDQGAARLDVMPPTQDQYAYPTRR